MNILIRYNTKSNKESDRWRLLIDNREFICAHIKIVCESETCNQPIIEDGKTIDKWHIKVSSFKELIFKLGENNSLSAIIL